MITIAFERNANSIYVAHTDILRSLNRTFRRAGIQVNYSKGYNRHMSLKLTQPLPFGVASKEEWVSADIVNDFSSEEIIRLFNENCPPTLHAYEAYKVESNPNLGGIIIASDYLIKTGNALIRKEQILEALKTLEVTVHKPDTEPVIKQVAELIYKAEITEEGIYLLMAFGNKNLRIDLVANKLNSLFDLGIEHTCLVRLHQYVQGEKGLVRVNEYIKGLV